MCVSIHFVCEKNFIKKKKTDIAIFKIKNNSDTEMTHPIRKFN